MDSTEAIVAMLAGRQSQKYSPEDMNWVPLGVAEPFDVRDGDVILVRAVGLKHQPEQLVHEVQLDQKYRSVSAAIISRPIAR